MTAPLPPALRVELDPLSRLSPAEVRWLANQLGKYVRPPGLLLTPGAALPWLGLYSFQGLEHPDDFLSPSPGLRAR